jgi:hypothetical protein
MLRRDSVELHLVDGLESPRLELQDNGRLRLTIAPHHDLEAAIGAVLPGFHERLEEILWEIFAADGSDREFENTDSGVIIRLPATGTVPTVQPNHSHQ